VSGSTLGPGPEFDLIRRFLERSPTTGADVLLGPGDDCALVSAPRIAVSADLSVEGVHFRREWLELEEIGYRATAAALSDLAAMASSPIGILASLALPPADVPEGAVRVMEGVREAVGYAGGALLGGDVVRSTGPLVLDIIVLGRADHAVLRSGARAGDELWVTGELGGAAAAVAAWSAGDTPDADARAAFAHPHPRIREALWLAERGALRALLDLSDGLAGDVRHLAAASEVGVVVEEAGVPVHPAAERSGRGLELALGGGEDYELCFAAPPGRVEPLAAAFRAAFGVALHRVGEVVAGEGVWLRRRSGALERLAAAGFNHIGR
jgi:thiamine-monophosphate kinase